MGNSREEGSSSMEISNKPSPYADLPARESREKRTTDEEESADEWADQHEDPSEDDGSDVRDTAGSRRRSKENNDPEDDFIGEYYGQPIIASEEEEDSSLPSYYSSSSFPRGSSPDICEIPRKNWHSAKRKRDTKFRDLVSSLPRTMTFEEACEKHKLEAYLIDGKDTKRQLEDDFIDIRLDLNPPESSETIRNWIQEYRRRRCRRRLYKVENPGRFIVTVVINGIEFKNVLCDAGSRINIMSREAYQAIGARGLMPSKIRVGMADATCTIPDGALDDVLVEIGKCDIPVDFEVINVSRSQSPQIILGTPFLATVGAVIDWPKRRMFFANIDRKVHYDITPGSGIELRVESRRERDNVDDEEAPSQPRRKRTRKTCPETSTSLN